MAGLWIAAESGQAYMTERGQPAKLLQEIKENGYGHLLERKREEFPLRPYSLTGVPVLFVPSGRTVTNTRVCYATNLHLDREKLPNIQKS